MPKIHPQHTIHYNNTDEEYNYIIGAMSLMILLGTLIGFIPAEKAIRVKPIDALRDE